MKPRAKRKKTTSNPAPPVFETDGGAFARDLLSWYDEHHRVLPWRHAPHSKRIRPVGDAVQSTADETTPIDQRVADNPQLFAYHVWVSEVMLQQTQVATVIPYFKKWVARWRSVGDLAEAAEEDIQKVWAGLGYYRRAAYLLKGARHIQSSLAGSFPCSAAELQSIPGIGPYTSAAVASIVHGEAVAAVDGNVIRVISRLSTLPGSPKTASMQAAVAELAQKLLSRERPGDFNQAMMELGATVCKPKAPECGRCPVRLHCRAVKRQEAGGGPVTDFPEKPAPQQKRPETVAVCVVTLQCPRGHAAGADPEAAGADPEATSAVLHSSAENCRPGAAASSPTQRKAESQRKISTFFTKPSCVPAHRWTLLVKRPPEGLLAGLWELPSIAVPEAESGAVAGQKQAEMWAAAASAAGQLLGLDGLGEAQSGCDWEVRRKGYVGSSVHVFSHIRMTMQVFRLDLAAPSVAAAEALMQRSQACGREVRWEDAASLKEMGLTTGVRKVLKMMQM